MHTIVRILPRIEWGRLLAFGPFKASQILPDPHYAEVVVEETELGRLVGCWMVTSIMLLEGLYRDPDVRKSFSAKGLLVGMLNHLRVREVKTAITVITDPEVEALAIKAGFVEIPGGKVYVLTLKGD